MHCAFLCAWQMVCLSFPLLAPLFLSPTQDHDHGAYEDQDCKLMGHDHNEEDNNDKDHKHEHNHDNDNNSEIQTVRQEQRGDDDNKCAPPHPPTTMRTM